MKKILLIYAIVILMFGICMVGFAQDRFQDKHPDDPRCYAFLQAKKISSKHWKLIKVNKPTTYRTVVVDSCLYQFCDVRVIIDYGGASVPFDTTFVYKKPFN